MKFKVGEIALHYPIKGIVRECEIIELPKDRVFICEEGIHFWTDLYLIAFTNGEVITCAEQFLRKLPPKQKTTTWDQCVWQPKGVEA